MPYRTREVLEEWLRDFPGYGDELRGHVALQDGSDGSDTGLVILRLRYATTGVFLQPVGRGDPRWEVVFEARHDELISDADGVDALGRELRLAAALCRHFEQKSRAYDGALTSGD